ncbi:MAG: glycoside hydrolase/phage tail family protein [Hyphomicrobiaceae bacterium]
MATLALAAVGAAVGGSLLPGGVSLLGATLTGASLGAQIGSLAGSFVDQALVGGSGQTRTFVGPRLADLRVTASQEGSPIPRVYGRARVGGQVIWATNLEEEAVTTRDAGGGGKGAPATPRTESTEYLYYANFAVAVAEGEISGIGRIWADGKTLDLTTVTYRVHSGGELQEPDPLIVAKEGPADAPAYRGTAYVVFERLPLAPFGNRLPQLSFEIMRAVDRFEQQVRAVTLIPAAGEFVYATTPVLRDIGLGATAAENVNQAQGASNFVVAVDQLQAHLPSVEAVSLFVAWFGNDLRCGACQVRPGVESTSKSTSPLAWSVAGATRSTAHLVSLANGRPAYGGTPSDASVVAAIKELKSRGLSVALTPLLLMDIPAGNGLPDPYAAGPEQAAHPWRGRITVSPAPGLPGSPDKSTGVLADIASFVGTAAPAHFTIAGESVLYAGPAEWTLRRQVLHYAHLCKAAGGVDAFVIGSELRGLTQLRSATSDYPFVAALVALAADVKSVLGPGTAVTYAADWSEYFGHQPADGSADAHFHLDPLWASPDIDAIGIDIYWPLADWRDGLEHRDALDGAASTYALDYLKANISGGEGYDWYYASDADRAAQVRSPITDGAGKPWVFRFKDIRNWWANPHFDRPGGSESTTPTAWSPQSKPIWFTEMGCPAVDKGANQPNVFFDPKSSESRPPHFSRGTRDDLVQRRYLQALLETFDPATPAFLTEDNPLSSHYAGRMVDASRMFAYTWDARPYPAFPEDTETWSDSGNWTFGHWLNGRTASAPLADLVARLLTDYGFSDHDASRLTGTATGFVIDRILSAREAIQPLELAFFFDAFESEGRLKFLPRAQAAPVLALSADGLVDSKPGSDLFTLTRAQETELPASAKIGYGQASGNYDHAVVESRRLVGASGRVAQAELPLVLEAEQAVQIADTWLFESWSGRERAAFSLPPSTLALEPGDLVTLTNDGRQRLLRIVAVDQGLAQDIEAVAADGALYAPGPAGNRRGYRHRRDIYGAPLVHFLDLPLLGGGDSDGGPRVAAFQAPWPGGVAVYASPEAQGYRLRGTARLPATLGVTLDALPPGAGGRLDHATRLQVRLAAGQLQTISHLQLLAGGNVAAVQAPNGAWEVLQFERAELVAPLTYVLHRLLRGQGGSEDAVTQPLPAGAPFVLLDGALARLAVADDELGLPLSWRYGPAARDIGDASYATTTVAMAGIFRRPLRPAHVRGVRQDGDLLIRWVRRTRIAGDSWDGLEVPLGESDERYEVDILGSGGGLLRTLSVNSPSAVYTAADQIADFGSLPGVVSVRVSQISATYGRGLAASADL